MLGRSVVRMLQPCRTVRCVCVSDGQLDLMCVHWASVKREFAFLLFSACPL